MRIYFGLLSILLLTLSSCKDNTLELQQNQVKLQAYNDSVFKVVDAKWNFKVPAVTQSVADDIQDWKQWFEFQEELKLKPVSSINAFQKKAEQLNTLMSALPNSLPVAFDQPEIKARLTVLVNTFNFIDMYLKVDPIPIQPINELLPQVNKQLVSLVQKMDEIKIKSAIPKEIGEEEMLRAMDTIRYANPIAQPKPTANLNTKAPIKSDKAKRSLSKSAKIRFKDQE